MSICVCIVYVCPIYIVLSAALPQCTVCTVCTVPENYFDELFAKCTVLLLMYGIVRFREKMCTVCTVILDYIYVRYCTVIIDHLLIETISGNSL